MLGLSWRPFNSEEEKQIIQCIQSAEQRTSGEIKVHVDKWCKTDPVYKATNVFHHLKMNETKARNGVLIYLALKEHRFAIIGDEGINEKVAADFWESTRDIMQSQFAEGQVVEGLCKGITHAADQLSEYFPLLDDDSNELSDDISYG